MQCSCGGKCTKCKSKKKTVVINCNCGDRYFKEKASLAGPVEDAKFEEERISRILKDPKVDKNRRELKAFMIRQIGALEVQLFQLEGKALDYLSWLHNRIYQCGVDNEKECIEKVVNTPVKNIKKSIDNLRKDVLPKFDFIMEYLKIMENPDAFKSKVKKECDNIQSQLNAFAKEVDPALVQTIRGTTAVLATTVATLVTSGAEALIGAAQGLGTAAATAGFGGTIGVIAAVVAGWYIARKVGLLG